MSQPHISSLLTPINRVQILERGISSNSSSWIAQILSQPPRICWFGRDRGRTSKKRCNLSGSKFIQVPASCEYQARLGVSDEAPLPLELLGFSQRCYHSWRLVFRLLNSLQLFLLGNFDWKANCLCSVPVANVLSSCGLELPGVCMSLCVCQVLERLEKNSWKGPAFLPLHHF